jgi:formylglycine-generating enzyme required for sulfatase activity
MNDLLSARLLIRLKPPGWRWVFACFLLGLNTCPVTAAVSGTAPRILQSPRSLNLPAGASFVLRTEAQGNPPMHYQWYHDDVLIPGAAQPEFAVYSAQPTNGGSYRVVITNALGSAQSDDALVQISLSAASLELGPSQTAYPPGAPVVLSVAASGTPPLHYQWMKNGTNIPQASFPVLPLSALSMADLGNYQVVAWNSLGAVTSQVFTLNLELYQDPFQLSVNKTDQQTVELNYSFGTHRGLLALYAADRLDDLLQSGVMVWKEAINGHGSRKIVLTNSAATTARFFQGVIHGLTTNPAPQIWASLAADSFTMGSPPDEPDRDADEGPQISVQFSQTVFMSRFEVTEAEFVAVMGFTPSYLVDNPLLPVEQVTWDDATNYCAKLTLMEMQAGRLPMGYEYRLPTEAEWEYAARAGSTTRFSFGEDPELLQLENYAWYQKNSSGIPHLVGTKLPNPWGLYDMHGNVGEWCSDYYGPLPKKSWTDPMGPTTLTIELQAWLAI